MVDHRDAHGPEADERNLHLLISGPILSPLGQPSSPSFPHCRGADAVWQALLSTGGKTPTLAQSLLGEGQPFALNTRLRMLACSLVVILGLLCAVAQAKIYFKVRFPQASGLDSTRGAQPSRRRRPPLTLLLLPPLTHRRTSTTRTGALAGWFLLAGKTR